MIDAARGPRCDCISPARTAMLCCFFGKPVQDMDEVIVSPKTWRPEMPRICRKHDLLPVLAERI
ncbi:hypothetical protein ET532_000340 [Verminephrobacter sp. Larva24]|uniref:hypothetical protein n=1 Tax=Verminephrobacter eiseniae TaxID=364317 RepID=UPI0010DF94AB|nr:hypothetical protein [Verminephrobacter eiseniae]KAB7634435.1 hypothetical protein ET532_000340 [Verminephrobacter sp. Larva24]MCW5262868.1 hypothetical protein [Verminephrobacter eiseniae]